MKVVIVGGGTAGWMTACYLKSALTHLQDVTLIESPGIGTIGVGEATFSTLKLFFDYLGLAESDWMPTCNATYKLAVRFQNWTRNAEHFYHPFERYEVVDGFNLGEWWLMLQRDRPFDAACFTTATLCDHMKSPRFLDGSVYEDNVAPYFGKHQPPNTVMANHTVQYPYGYHFDAALLAGFLQKRALERGVRHISDDVVDVKLGEDGSIAHIVTREHGCVPGDLFVDCTGFRGLLINQALKEPFISFHQELPNDRAVAIQVPSDPEREGIRPYTTATALSAGWAWTIPLYDRNGCGYVYCSEYLSPEQAEAELRRFLGPRSEGRAANHIRMRIGRNRNSWIKNCVAIGLSSGFVEPLESTGIFFIQHGIEELVNHFPSGRVTDPGQLLSYNRTINDCIDGVREFLSVHYRATSRDDTDYWKDMRRLTGPELLEERLRIWKCRLPGVRNVYQPFHGFEAYSYSAILLGMGYQPPAHLPALDYRDVAGARERFRSIQAKSERLARTLPSHYEYLRRMRTAPEEFAAAKGDTAFISNGPPLQSTSPSINVADRSIIN